MKQICDWSGPPFTKYTAAILSLPKILLLCTSNIESQGAPFGKTVVLMSDIISDVLLHRIYLFRWSNKSLAFFCWTDFQPISFP